MTLKRFIFETKADYVFKTIKNKILTGEWKQGQDIIISKVAEELQVSTIPVREALKRLQMEGLIDIIPHKGACVTTLDRDKINEIISIRAVLEGYAARTAVPFIDENKFSKIKEMADKMNEYAVQGDDEQFANANKEFHRFLYKQSPFKMLYDMIFKLWDGGNWSKSVFAFNPSRMRESVKEHYEIIEAIKEKDEEKVEYLVRQHKLKNAKLLEQVSEKRFREKEHEKSCMSKNY
jgi:DNA-binding GntR family transcriptional regulator